MHLHKLALSAAAALSLMGAHFRAVQANPNALWRIAHDECVPDMLRANNPAPCLEVELAGGYAVLKDRVGPRQILLIPTARVTGIEDPALLTPGAPNYWEDAWQARRFLGAGPDHSETLPRDAIAMAVNAITGRSQDQLHIHVDCIRPDVREALSAHAADIGDRWAPFPVPLNGHRYLAMRVAGEDLGSVNPFQVLATEPEASDDMGYETLVVVGKVLPDGRPGFYLLADHADPLLGDRGNGESLEDHSCAIAPKG